jgi:hypothetical protein
MTPATKIGHDFSTEELVCLAELLGSPEFPGVDAQPLAVLSADTRDAVLRSARRGLVARGVVTIGDDGRAAIESPYREMLAVALAPSLHVTAERRSRTLHEIRVYLAQPQGTVEESVLVGGVYRLAPIDTADLVRRIVAFTALAWRTTGSAAGFVLPQAALDDLLKRAASGATENLADGLPSAGRGFADALSGGVVNAVRILYRHGRTLRGGIQRWIDGGEHGSWILDENGDADVTIRPSAGQDVLDNLLRYLPGGEPRTSETQPKPKQPAKRGKAKR